jgi:hypothetical protein
VRRTLAVLLLVPALLAGCSVGLPKGVIYPSIALDETVTEDIPVTRTFLFEGRQVTLNVTVDGSLYAGAQTAEKTVTRFGNARENDWIEDYWPAFINETHQDGFYDSVLAALRQVRDSAGLDADRYAELMTVFVQSLAYQTDPVDLEPKFPVETFVDGAGDCDDKTLLLAGLLSREGYDVAILMFEPEKHVALGIKSADIGYLDTGYAYVETTAQGFIGMVPDSFGSGLTLTSEPRVFGVDGGTLSYTAGDEVTAILDGRAEAISRASDLATQISAADAELAQLQSELQDLQAELDSLRSSGRTAEYNAKVPEYNKLVDEYNDAAEERNALADAHNALADVDRIVVEGLDDRPGTYAAVMTALQ